MIPIPYSAMYEAYKASHAINHRPILNTTASLFKAPALDLNSPAQLEIDKAKLAIRRANQVLRKLEKTDGCPECWNLPSYQDCSLCEAKLEKR